MPGSTYQTERSHEAPFAVQFSVFMPNRVGQFRELLDEMAEKPVRLVGVSVVDSSDWAVVRMVFTDADLARAILKKAGHSFTESEVLLVVLDAEDTLRQVCSYLLRGEINVHFAFSLTLRCQGSSVMAFHVDDTVLAREILLRHGLTLLGWEDLASPEEQ